MEAAEAKSVYDAAYARGFQGDRTSSPHVVRLMNPSTPSQVSSVQGVTHRSALTHLPSPPPDSPHGTARQAQPLCRLDLPDVCRSVLALMIRERSLRHRASTARRRLSKPF
jgi:hypothetical protein